MQGKDVCFIYKGMVLGQPDSSEFPVAGLYVRG